MIGTFSWAQQAVPWALEKVEELQRDVPANPENPDPQFYMGIGDPNLPASNMYQNWRMSEVRARLLRDGPVVQRLGQQWIVGMSTGWEHEFRPRLADAHGCATDRITHDVFGDLRHMRNDVVHHHGIAQADESGRCKTLQWSTVGQPIEVRGQQYADFVRQLPFDLAPS